ncbi:MAG: phosphoribosylglycinamide synthetase C domain-containing protein, partial [Candidatus Omnitrophota bacterium]
GMGAYSPAPVVDDKLFKEIIKKIIEPAVKGMKKRGTPHKGVLYAGVMITKDGPSLLEFNVRFGDPETQAIVPRMDFDLLELIEASIKGSIKMANLKWSQKACVCVVMASGGYPGKYEKHTEIKNIEKASKLKDVLIFHAGTKLNSKLVTDGGRVLNVVGLGENIKDAVDKAYSGCELIDFAKKHYRKDIGYRALAR